MSVLITLTTGESETIHGASFEAAEQYVAMKAGAAAAAWRGLSDDDKMRTLATAVRYFAAQTWVADADTFGKRDLIAAFTTAQYELAVLIADDDSVIAEADQGSNIASLAAGSASLTFFNPTTKDPATMPAAVERLVGKYLATTTSRGPLTGSGVTGSSCNPFGSSNSKNRNEPY